MTKSLGDHFRNYRWRVLRDDLLTAQRERDALRSSILELSDQIGWIKEDLSESFTLSRERDELRSRIPGALDRVYRARMALQEIMS